MANPYSIHLVETLSLEAAHRIATETASQLGGTPDKLAQLLTRDSGSRIARASSAAQAERVANILRKAGVSVEVIEPENLDSIIPVPVVPIDTKLESGVSLNAQKPEHTDAVPSTSPVQTSNNYNPNAGASNTSSGGVPIVPDEIFPVDDEPYKPPVQASIPTPDPFPAANDPFSSTSDSFTQTGKNVFNTSVPFTPASNDPFSAPANNTFPTMNSDPFAAPTSDPFAAPTSDPFAANVNDAFAAASSRTPIGNPSNDPFASPATRDPFAPMANTPNQTATVTPAFDPFSAGQTASVASDLPTQALKAQNRATGRTSVRAQLLRSILFPILLVGFGIMAFLAYQLNIIYRDQLRIRAVQASATIAAEQKVFFDKLPDPAALAQINGGAQEFFKLIPEAELTFFESGDPKLVTMTQLSTQTRDPNMSTAVKQDISQKMNVLEGNSGAFSVAGVDYIGAITPMQRDDGTTIGDIHVAFSTTKIATEVLNAIVPLLIALGIVTLLSIVLANTLASRLVRPITAAADQANRISLGDLDRVVDIQSNDEIGDLLGSLERMRVSLKSVIGRLRRDR